MCQLFFIGRIPKLYMITLQKILQRRWILPGRYILPNNPRKKYMLLQLLKRNPLLWILLQQFDQHITKIMPNFSNNTIQHFFNVCFLDVLLNLLVCVKLVILEEIPSEF